MADESVTEQDREKARSLYGMQEVSALNEREDIIDAIASALAAARQSGATAERVYIVKQIRKHATTITFFAKGRALDLLAWILTLPGGAGERAKGEWVRCSERMPALGEWVLGVDGRNRVEFFLYDEDGWNDQGATPIGSPEYRPTHWRPLPEPPSLPEPTEQEKR